jgi:hypothetical protein
MAKLLKVRTLSPDERTALETARHSCKGFTIRRSQIILASASGQTPAEIAKIVGLDPDKLGPGVPRIRHR